MSTQERMLLDKTFESCLAGVTNHLKCRVLLHVRIERSEKLQAVGLLRGGTGQWGLDRVVAMCELVLDAQPLMPPQHQGKYIHSAGAFAMCCEPRAERRQGDPQKVLSSERRRLQVCLPAAAPRCRAGAASPMVPIFT